MKKFLVLTTILLLGLSSVLLARPGQREDNDCMMGGPGMMGPNKMMMMKMDDCSDMCMMNHRKPGIKMILAMGDKLNLTDAQQQKLQEMMVNFQLERVDQKAQLEKAQIKLRALMRNNNAAENDVMAAIDNVAKLKAEMKKMAYRHMQEAKKILTQDQIDQLKQLRREKMKCKKNMGMRMEKGGHGMWMEKDNDD
ncbi:MAG: periplasmic heavy metal sensor [FCB group bacterium]|nr:periplasmic heavy metal sensor [FCB group bacterium]